MSRFENKLCPVCREKFSANDDIVVCPDCGTPHHRICWEIENRCALEELHGMNYAWNGRLPDEPPEPPQQPSEPPIHESLSDDNAVSGLQGELFEQMSSDPVVEKIVKKINDNKQSADGVSMKELAAYSATSIWHYARAFMAFRGENDGKKRVVFFNFCSGLFAPIFQFYRKMDLFGIITIVALVLPSFLVMRVSGGTTGAAEGFGTLMSFVVILEEILLCLFSDFIYYKHAVKRIRKIRTQYQGDVESDDYFMTLYESGKPSFARAALGMLAMLFVEAFVMTVLI